MVEKFRADSIASGHWHQKQHLSGTWKEQSTSNKFVLPQPLNQHHGEGMRDGLFVRTPRHSSDKNAFSTDLVQSSA